MVCSFSWRCCSEDGSDCTTPTVLPVSVVLTLPCRGGNQGLIKIITHGVDKDPECKPPTPVHETKLSARLDGGKSAGMIAVSKAVEMAIAKVSIRIRGHLQIDLVDVTVRRLQCFMNTNICAVAWRGRPCLACFTSNEVFWCRGWTGGMLSVRYQIGEASLGCMRGGFEHQGWNIEGSR